MTHEILMSFENGLLRVAQVEDGHLTALQAAPLGKADAQASMVGQISLARAARDAGRLQAAFVHRGCDSTALSAARDALALVLACPPPPPTAGRVPHTATA